jgi:phosphopantetheinyl transferase (holo-ACP synthase)
MLGNDVVDLKLAKQQIRWNTKAFQQKVLHPKEMNQYNSSPLRYNDFWKIWSIKETAYKAHQRNKNHRPKFNPFDFLVEINSSTSSKVILDNYEYNIISFVTDKYIYSYTASNDVYSVQNFDLNLKNTFYNEGLKRQYLNNRVIKNEYGIPFLLENNKAVPISITHHGSYFAYLR